MNDSYSEREDVASSIAFRERAETDPQDLPMSYMQPYGPGIEGCLRHRKALMLSYKENEVIKDIFLSGKTATDFIADVDAARKKLSLKPLIVSLDLVLGKERKSFIFDRKRIQFFFKEIDYCREEVAAYVTQHGVADSETTPVRQKPWTPPTEEETKAWNKTYDQYYKPEPRDLNLEGVDMGLLLAALYNNAPTGGAARMTPLEGRHIFEEIKRIKAPTHLDYVNGRSIKCWFDQSDGKDVLSFSRYWEYNGIPVSALIALAKKEIYDRLPKKEGVLHEAASLCFSLLSSARESSRRATAAEFASAMDGFVAALDLSKVREKQKASYGEAMRARESNTTYQISIIGQGEVGHLIGPFTLKKSLRLIKGNKPTTLDS